jgi:hypothetical protein
VSRLMVLIWCGEATTHQLQLGVLGVLSHSFRSYPGPIRYISAVDNDDLSVIPGSRA